MGWDINAFNERYVTEHIYTRAFVGLSRKCKKSACITELQLRLYRSRVTATPYTARGTPERSERNFGMSDSPYHPDVTNDPKSSAKCRPHGDVSTCISTNLCHSRRQRLRKVAFLFHIDPTGRLLDEATRHLVPFKTAISYRYCHPPYGPSECVHSPVSEQSV